MKGNGLRNLVFVLLALGVLSGVALALVEAQVNMTCNFNVEDTVLPAGKYDLRQVSGTAYLMESPALKVAIVFQTVPGGTVAGGTPKDMGLVFKIYGDRYFLSSLQLIGDPTEYKLTPHSTEKELMAKGAPRTEVVRCVMMPK